VNILCNKYSYTELPKKAQRFTELDPYVNIFILSSLKNRYIHRTDPGVFMRTIRSRFPLFLLSFLFITGCGESFISNSITYRLDPITKRWLVSEAIEETGFLLGSDSSFNESYGFVSRTIGFDKSIHSSGFSKEEEEYEVIFQKFRSDLDSRFEITLRHNEPERGASISVLFDSLRFEYNLMSSKLYFVSFIDEYKHLYFFENQYFIEDTIYSRVILLDTVTINNLLYYGAMEFHLNDFSEKWQPWTIVSFTIAKQYGLIRYEYNNGMVVERQ